MLERTDAITHEVLEPITFVLAYPTACHYVLTYFCARAKHLKQKSHCYIVKYST